MNKNEEKSIRSILETELSESEKFDIIKAKLNGLRHRIISNFSNNDFNYNSYEDLLSHLDIILLKCIRQFNHKYNNKFITYFYVGAENELKRILKRINKDVTDTMYIDDYVEGKSFNDKALNKKMLSKLLNISEDYNYEIAKIDIEDIINRIKGMLSDREFFVFNKRINGVPYKEFSKNKSEEVTHRVMHSKALKRIKSVIVE